MTPELTISWGLAARLWWNVIWRSVLVGVFAAGAAAGMTGAALSLSGAREAIEYLAGPMGFAAFLATNLWATKTSVGRLLREISQASPLSALAISSGEIPAALANDASIPPE